jgi:hypothetical protein
VTKDDTQFSVRQRCIVGGREGKGEPSRNARSNLRWVLGLVAVNVLTP